MFFHLSQFVRIAMMVFISYLLPAFNALSFQTLTAEAPSQGPGISKQHFTEAELFTVISRINQDIGSHAGHSSAVMFQGYLVIVEASDSGLTHNSAISFWDISDARQPKLVKKHTKETVAALANIPEGHSIGFIRRDGLVYTVLRSATGITLWDWSDINHIKQVAALALPPLTGGDYANAAWWFANVGRYIYVSGTNHGLFVVDAANINKLSVVKRIPISQTGGFKLGAIFGQGNLLVATTFDEQGIVTFDISEPSDPKINDIIKDKSANIGYSAMFNGGYLYGGDVIPKVWDLREPSDIKLISQYSGIEMGNKGAYSKFQDGFVHQGVSTNSAWIDYRDPKQPKVVNIIPRIDPRADLDTGNIAGHLGIASCDHAKGSQIFPLHTQPDTLAPSINYVLPKADATQVAVTTSIGVSFTDQLEQHSVSAETLYLENSKGEKIAAYYSVHDNLVSITPEQPLQQEASYRLIVKANGIRDFAQNAITEQSVFRFSTGEKFTTSQAEINVKQQQQQTRLTLRGVDTPWWHFFSDDISVAWDFGDGNQVTDAGMAINHHFSQAGRYIVKARFNENGRDQLVSKIAVVAEHFGQPKGYASHSVISSPDSRYIYVTNSDNNTITAIDQQSYQVIFESKVGEKPRTLAYGDNDVVWSTNQVSDELIAIDAKTGKLLTKIALPYGTRPYGLLILPTLPDYAFVSSESIGVVYKVNLKTQTFTVSKPLTNSGLRGLAYSEITEQLYAARFISAQHQGEIIALDPETLVKIKTIPLAVDLGPDKEDGGRGVPNYLSQLAISPNGKMLWAPSKKDNTERGLSKDGLALTFDNSVRAIIAKVDLLSATERINERVDFDDRALAHTAIFSPNGSYIFVSLQGSNVVEIFNAHDGAMAATINVKGIAPEGLALSTDGNTLFVHSQLSREVEVYDVSLVTQQHTPQTHFITRVNLVENELFAPQILKGKQVFYNASDPRMSLNGYLSCASCHLDGGQDGRVWDFTDRGEGLRNTTSLNGPDDQFLHWSANFNEMQDFENDIRGPFSGVGFTFGQQRLTHKAFSARHGGLLGKAVAGVAPELDALTAYVATLTTTFKSPYRQSDGSLTEDGQAGRKIFEQLQCYACHGGDNFAGTRAGMIANVGSLSPTSGHRMGQKLLGIDIPTLRGIWHTAPYLHDGSAATLAAVLTTRNINGQHGATQHLTEIQLQQLISFLQQIDSSEAATKPARTTDLPNGQLFPIISNAADINQLGKHIAKLVEHNQPLPPFSALTAYNLKDAYQVQKVFTQARRPFLGQTTGFKVAFASKASQKAWGLTEAVSASLFEQQALNNMAELNKDDFQHFHIEAEIAFVLSKKIDSMAQIGELFNKNRLKNLVASVHIAFDIPDNRFQSKPAATDIIASGAGAEYYLLGKAVNAEKINLDKLALKMFRDGKLVYQGLGKSVMGSPWKALHWLLKSQLAQGNRLPKGTVILTGAVDKAYGATTKNVRGVYQAQASGLGSITVKVK